VEPASEKVAADEAGSDEAAKPSGDDDGAPAPPLPKPIPEAPPGPRPSYVFLIAGSIVFFLADFVSKWWVVHHVEPKARVHADGWYLRLNRVQNPGGAWGIFGDQPDYVRLPFFFLISAIAVVFVISLYRKLEPRQRALRWALPLLLGGAAGNLLDRIRHKSVVDFLEFTIIKQNKEWFRWPTFNVADIWICAGVILMAIDMFTPRKPIQPPITDDELDDEDEDEPAGASQRAHADDPAKDKPAKAEA
jgi:signal peptidase II